MIFGENGYRAFMKEQEHRSEVFGKVFTTFALFPIRVCSGEWVWMENVYYTHRLLKTYAGWLEYYDTKHPYNYFLTQEEADNDIAGCE